MKDKFLLKRIYIPFGIIFCFGIFIVLTYGIYSFNKTKEEVYSQVSKALKSFYNLKIEEKKEVGLTDVLIVSNDSIIKKALKINNRPLAIKEINLIIHSLKEYTKFKNIKIHLHSSNLTSFLRSWNLNKYGDKLSSFRKSLVWVKTYKKPLVAIEIGRVGIVLRAIAPVMENGKYIGSVEVMQGLNSVAKDLKREDISFIVALKKKYLNIATFLNKSKAINKDYILALRENSYDKMFFNELKNKKISAVIETKHFYAISIPIKDFEGKIVAYAIVGKNKKDIQKLFSQKIADIIVSLIVVNLVAIILTIFIVFTVKELRKTFQKAIKDPLTGLYNRSYFSQRLRELLSKAKRENSKVMVIFLDLNNFKQVNDTLGHERGDEVLKGVSDLIKHFFREYDLLARFGGDEFVIALEVKNGINIKDRMEKLNEAVKEMFKKEEISIAYGIATSDESFDIDELISLADERMYENKKAQKANR